MITRRKSLIALDAGALSAGALAPLVSFAQQPGKVWRLGILSPVSQSVARDVELFGSFVAGLRELGSGCASRTSARCRVKRISTASRAR